MGPLIGAEANISSQKAKQTNENIQEDLKQITTNNKAENIQDYTTYIRTSNRTTEELKKNIKASMKAAQDLIAENELNITGCAIFNDKFNNEQSIDLDQTLDQGVEALQSSVEKIKASAETNSTTDIKADQSAENKQGSQASSELESEQLNDNQQQANQENFSTVGRMSVLRMLGGFNGLGRMGNNIRNKRIKEGMLFGVAANISMQDTEQVNKNRQTSQQILNSNNELYNKISTAYDKIVEVVNTITSEEEKQAEITAENKMKASNKNNIGVDPEIVFKHGGGDVSKCLVFNGEFNNKQTINATASLFMKGVIDQMSSTDVDNETKAIMADMLGIIQSNKSDQEQSASTKLGNKQGNTSKQITDQSNGSWIETVLGIIALLAILWFFFRFFSLGFPKWFQDWKKENNENEDGAGTKSEPTDGNDKADDGDDIR